MILNENEILIDNIMNKGLYDGKITVFDGLRAFFF